MSIASDERVTASKDKQDKTPGGGCCSVGSDGHAEANARRLAVGDAVCVIEEIKGGGHA